MTVDIMLIEFTAAVIAIITSAVNLTTRET
jgi:hypothetical protein